ncbi:MAG: LysR family transcriptional regulator [Halioglobus sp.]
MNWDDARIFLTFAREMSYSGAAKRLGVQHSTISRRIQALEKQLASSLVERDKSGYRLTPAGEDLKVSALRMEQELLSFEAANAFQNDEVSGELVITAVANMASTILMPLFAGFSRTYPNIELRIEVTNDSVRLSKREADIALRQTNSPDETLIGARLATVASAVYGETAYCAAVNVGDCAEQWIGVDCCDFHRTWTRQACPQANHPMWVDDTSLTLAALKAGLGVGYLPCFIGDSDAALTRFRALEIKHNLGLWLLYHRDLRDTRRVQLFREHMVQEIEKVAPLFEGKGGLAPV